MLSRRAAEDPTLYEALIRRGLPAGYARRTAEELDDHRVDLLADVLDERTADERIGETRALAKQIARDYRRRSWFGRWPLVSFVLGPIPLLLLSWIGVGCGLYALGAVLDLFYERPRGPLTPIETQAAEAAGIAGLAVLFYLLPALIAWRYGALALRTTQKRAYLVVVCLVLGLGSGLVSYETEVWPESDGTAHGKVTVGVPLEADGLFGCYAKPDPLMRVLTPLVVGGLVLWADYRRRVDATISPQDGGGQLPLAA